MSPLLFAMPLCVLVTSLFPREGVALPLRLRCPPDQAPVGTVCVDKYEACVWRLPSDPIIVRKAVLGLLSAEQLRPGREKLEQFLQAYR